MIIAIQFDPNTQQMNFMGEGGQPAQLRQLLLAAVDMLEKANPELAAQPTPKRASPLILPVGAVIPPNINGMPR